MTEPEFNRAKLHNRRSNKMTEPEFNRAKEKKSKLISKKSIVFIYILAVVVLISVIDKLGFISLPDFGIKILLSIVILLFLILNYWAIEYRKNVKPYKVNDRSKDK